MLSGQDQELDSLRTIISDQEKILVDRSNGVKELLQGKMLLKSYPDPHRFGQHFQFGFGFDGVKKRSIVGLEQYKSFKSFQSKKQRIENLKMLLDQINTTNINDRMPIFMPVGVQKELTPIQNLYNLLVKENQQTQDIRLTATVH